MQPNKIIFAVILAACGLYIRDHYQGISPTPEAVGSAKVLITFHQGDLGKYPAAQEQIFHSTIVDEYLDNKAASQHHTWDCDVNTSNLDTFWKAAVEKAKAKPQPHMMVWKGKTLKYDGTPGKDPNQTVSILEPILGK